VGASDASAIHGNSDAPWSIVNRGAISSFALQGFGIKLDGSGTIVNAGSGSISGIGGGVYLGAGGRVTDAGAVSGYFVGIDIAGAVGTVTNAGGVYSGSYGIELERHGFITPAAVRQSQLQPAALAA
jgi:hypothetical protein